MTSSSHPEMRSPSVKVVSQRRSNNLAEEKDFPFPFPLEHQCSIRTTNSLERINKEIRRHTRVVGLTVQNLLSAANRITALMAFIRGFIRHLTN